MYHYGDRSYGEPDYSHLDANEAEGPEDFTLAFPSNEALAQARPNIVRAIEEAFETAEIDHSIDPLTSRPSMPLHVG